MLDDPVTAQYTHTLNVTRRSGGTYTCTVANDISKSSIGLYIDGKTECGTCTNHSITFWLYSSSLLSS